MDFQFFSGHPVYIHLAFAIVQRYGNFIVFLIVTRIVYFSIYKCLYQIKINLLHIKYI